MYYATHPASIDVPPGMATVTYQVPASRYDNVKLQEALLTAGFALPIAVFSFIVVQHRRPY